MSADKWVAVPVEPTDEMIEAFAETWFKKRRCIDDPELSDAYAAMLAAVPVIQGSVPEGWKLAMRVLQSDLYRCLDDAERAECDALAAANPFAAPRSTETGR